MNKHTAIRMAKNGHSKKFASHTLVIRKGVIQIKDKKFILIDKEWFNSPAPVSEL